jgi:hypothetical protein
MLTRCVRAFCLLFACCDEFNPGDPGTAGSSFYSVKIYLAFVCPGPTTLQSMSNQLQPHPFVTVLRSSL